MKDFSDVVMDELYKRKKTIAAFAGEMKVSYQYMWRLLKKRKGRWNEDSMKKACETLGIEIKFVSKSA